MSDFANMEPGRLAAFLHMRGLGDLGELVKRRFQALEHMVQKCHDLQMEIRELQTLIPDDVWQARQQAQEEYAASLRNGGGGLRRAPAESDG